MEAGLDALAALCRDRGAEDLAGVDAGSRREVLNELAASQPAFLPGLVFHTFTGYYQEPRVLQAIGMEPRPPHPQGYELETGDLDLLEPVRQRGKLYRG